MLAELLADGAEGFALGVDGGLVAGLDGFFGFGDGGFDLGLVVADLVAVLGQGLLDRMDQPSSWLRASTSSWAFLSSSAWASASRTMRWISSSDRPELALMVILFSLPVALSWPDTCRMPLASMSKVTSICGMPRGPAGCRTG